MGPSGDSDESRTREGSGRVYGSYTKPSPCSLPRLSWSPSTGPSGTTSSSPTTRTEVLVPGGVTGGESPVAVVDFDGRHPSSQTPDLDRHGVRRLPDEGPFGVPGTGRSHTDS